MSFREKVSIVILLVSVAYCVPVTIGIGMGAINPDGFFALFYFLSIPITVIGLPPYAFRFLKTRIVALIEARDFAAGGVPGMQGQEVFARKLFPFPIFLVVTVVLTGLALFAWRQQARLMQLSLLASEQSQDESGSMNPFSWVVLTLWETGLMFWVVLILFMVMTFVGFLEHVRPNGDRRRAHDYALASAATVFVFGLAGLFFVDVQQSAWQPWLVELPIMALEQAQDEPTGMKLFFGAVLTLPVALFFLAFREHVRPYGNRRLKYDYALALASTMWLGRELIVGSYEALVYQPLIVLALALVISSSMRLICKPTDNPGPAARHIHRWIKVFVDWPLVVVLAVWQPIALAVVLVMRYRSVQWMANCPIVYLRSFSQENAPRVFQKVISSPANKYGVLVALVHRTQSASHLKTGSDLLEGSQFSGSTDDKWKAWVADKIEHASAVIIDYSIATEGIRWEVERAMKHTDPERIVLLAQHDSTIEVPAGAHAIKYEDSEAGFEAVRAEFDDWVYARIMG